MAHPGPYFPPLYRCFFLFHFIKFLFLVLHFYLFFCCSAEIEDPSYVRITRSKLYLFELIDYIRNKKASLKSLKDIWLDLSEDNPYSQFLITVMAGVNQLERDLIRMRQREGIELAKKEGKFKGRI